MQKPEMYQIKIGDKIMDESKQTIFVIDGFHYGWIRLISVDGVESVMAEKDLREKIRFGHFKKLDFSN